MLDLSSVVAVLSQIVLRYIQERSKSFLVSLSTGTYFQFPPLNGFN